jgi:hypothetical protein
MEHDRTTISLSYDLLKEQLFAWSDSYSKSSGYLSYFMGPYFEKNLNRIGDLQKNFKFRSSLLTKRAKEEAKLRLDAVISVGKTNANFDSRQVSFTFS